MPETTTDNPLLLANRKAKKLKDLLRRQRSLNKQRVPYVEPIVSLWHQNVRCDLSGAARTGIYLRSEARSNAPGMIEVFSVSSISLLARRSWAIVSIADCRMPSARRCPMQEFVRRSANARSATTHSASCWWKQLCIKTGKLRGWLLDRLEAPAHRPEMPKPSWTGGSTRTDSRRIR